MKSPAPRVQEAKESLNQFGPPNPEQDPGMQRRLLLVFVLTFVVILIAEPLIMKYARPAQPPAPPQQQSPPPVPQPSPSGTQPATVTAGQPAAAAPAARQVSAASESETVIENDLYKITFTNRGAQVKSWVLKHFDDEQGNPLDLVNPHTAPQFGYPLSLFTYDEGVNKQLAEALYVPSVTGTQRAPASLTFEYAQGDLSVRKSFSFDHSYLVKVETEVTRAGQPVQAYPAWPAGFGDQGANPVSFAASRVDYQNGNKIERLEPKKVSGGNTVRGPFHWAGALDQYFGAVFLPSDPDNAVLVTLHRALRVPKDLKNPKPDETVELPVLGAAVGNANGPTQLRLFVGPKSLDALRQVQASPTAADRAAGMQSGPNLEGLVDFGFFSVISKPLFLWLKWTYAHWVQNWGWAILILTIIINVALFPLKLSSMKSALKMQKLAPQMKAIQEKYKKYSMRDPRRADANKEIAALYKAHGANPVGGCLPMILQLPFLWAFYTMLGIAIELRHAHWGWIHDLSAPDPWHVLPIAIFVTMLILQKMTPSAGMDPAQQKMMLLMMPAFIAVISWNLAAGLCLYWAAGNVIAILQQVYVNNTAFGREIREAAAKRAAKKK